MTVAINAILQTLTLTLVIGFVTRAAVSERRFWRGLRWGRCLGVGQMCRRWRNVRSRWWLGMQTTNHYCSSSSAWTYRSMSSADNARERPLYKNVKLAHTRVPSAGFQSWSRFLAVSLQVTRVTNPVVGCPYFPPGPQLPSQPLRGLLPILLLGEQRHDRCEQFA